MRISVVLCTYNGEAYLREQLESIGRQTRPPDELLILDDVSRDSSVAIATEFARGAPFPVEVVRNETNLGFAKNFERGISLATGDVIALSDQDDIWRETRLLRIEEAFRQNPEAALVFSDAEVVDRDRRSLGYRLWEATGFTRAKQVLARNGRMIEVLAKGTVVTGATAAFRSDRRGLILPIGPGMEHDAWIALLLAAVAPVVAISEPLIEYRQHGGNQIGARRLSIRDRVRRASETRIAGIEHRRNLYILGLERLRDHGAGTEHYALLQDAIDHLHVRIALARRRGARFRPILRELMNGRYRRISGSFASACRDLLV